MQDFITDLIIIFFMLVAFGLIGRIMDAIEFANNSRPYSPPDQLSISKDNEWVSEPGSQRLAWWRTFWSYIKDDY